MLPTEVPEIGVSTAMILFLCKGNTQYCHSDLFKNSNFRKWYKAIGYKSKRVEHKRFKKLFYKIPAEFRIYYGLRYLAQNAIGIRG